MKVLVIPDVHLKPFIFIDACRVMEEQPVDIAVCLGDLVDDFHKQNQLMLYEQTFNAAMMFQKEYPNTLWCYGNHDKSYVWMARETGFSDAAVPIVRQRLGELEKAVGENFKYVHKIDNVLFSHAGLTRGFVWHNLPHGKYDDVDEIVRLVNDLGYNYMWSNSSPLWYRPYNKNKDMYKVRKCMQVIGHTPTKSIEKIGNVLMCDSFSTCVDGTPYGPQAFTVVDTETWEWYTCC